MSCKVAVEDDGAVTVLSVSSEHSLVVDLEFVVYESKINSNLVTGSSQSSLQGYAGLVDIEYCSSVSDSDWCKVEAIVWRLLQPLFSPHWKQPSSDDFVRQL